MASEYRRVDQGTDANGKPWSVGALGDQVIIDIDLRHPHGYYAFGAAERDRFAHAWAEAERQAEAAP